MDLNTTPILDNLLCGIQILDSQWRYVYVNKLAEQHARLKREQLIGRTIGEKFPGLQDSELFQAMRACEQQQQSRQFENFFEYPDGSTAWFELHIQPIAAGLLIISNDITQRKSVEQELKQARDEAKERERNLNAIYNTVGNVIFILTVEPGERYRFESVNDQFVQSTGLPREAIVGQLVQDIIPEPSLTMVLEKYKTAIRENRIVRWEEVSRYPTGELTGEVSIAPNFDDRGNCRFLVGAVHDITEQKRNQKLLEEKNVELRLARYRAEENEAKIRAYTEQSPIAIFTMDIHGQFLHANKKWLEMAGMSLQRAAGDGWLLAIHPDDRESIREIWLNSIGSLEEWSYECRFIDAGGATTWIEGFAKALRDGKSNLIGYTGNNIDITDRKLAEKAVMENQRVKAVGELASAIAHDFNNSLQSISGNIELALLRGGMPATTTRSLENVQSILLDASQRAQTVQRFAGNSGCHAEQARLNINELVARLVQNSEHLWKDEVEKNGIDLNVKLELGDTRECYGVEGEISAVLLNFLKNSIEAMPDGGEILIQTRAVATGTCIRIRDNGIGMDGRARERAFQPFFTTKGFDQGRGLGMSGAYGIIKEHGGEVSILETAPNQGTTIEIFLPAAIDHDEQRQALPAKNSVG